MADYDVPKITGEDGILDVPSLQPDTMKGHGPWVSKPDFQEDMHFPTDFTMPEGVDNYGDASTLVENWKERALDKMGDLKESLNNLVEFCKLTLRA